MKAVSNSSSLIGLSAIGQLELLAKRFPDGIFVPNAVWKEVVEQGGGRPGSEEVAAADWIHVLEVQDNSFVNLLRGDLDEGEAAAIALFREQQADVILLDEKDARLVARKLGMPVLGAVGILIWATREGIVKSLSEQLDALQIHQKAHDTSPPRLPPHPLPIRHHLNRAQLVRAQDRSAYGRGAL